MRYLPVEHLRNRQESPEEVEIVRAEVERCRGYGLEGVLVVFRYDAQVNALREALPGARVGTVASTAH